MDDDARRLIHSLSKIILQLWEQQERIQASVRALQGFMMEIKGVPPTHALEFLAALAPVEEKLLEASPNAETVRQLRALVDLLEGGHDPSKVDA